MQQPYTSGNSFKVIVRRKIPFLTNILFGLLTVFACYLFLFYVLFIPVKNTLLDIQVLYFIRVLPGFIRITFIISVISIVLITPFYIHMRKYKGAVLQVFTDHVLIRGKSLNENIPASTIKRIYIMDPKTSDGISEGKLTIYIHQKRRRKIKERIFRIQLKDYLQAERLVDSFMKFQNIDFKFYDFHANPDPEKEV